MILLTWFMMNNYITIFKVFQYKYIYSVAIFFIHGLFTLERGRFGDTQVLIEGWEYLRKVPTQYLGIVYCQMSGRFTVGTLDSCTFIFHIIFLWMETYLAKSLHHSHTVIGCGPTNFAKNLQRSKLDLTVVKKDEIFTS